MLTLVGPLHFQINFRISFQFPKTQSLPGFHQLLSLYFCLDMLLSVSFFQILLGLELFSYFYSLIVQCWYLYRDILFLCLVVL